MRLNNQAVLEPLHLEPADLSSGRRLVQEAAGEAVDENPEPRTCSVLETRGLLFRPAGRPALEAAGDNLASGVTSVAGLNQEVPEPTLKPLVVWLPVVPLSRDAFEVLQKFEGTVSSVRSDAHAPDAFSSKPVFGRPMVARG